MNGLQKSLIANALFSTFSGLLLILFSGFINGLFDTNNSTVFVVTGILLIGFAATILIEVKKQRYKGVMWIIAQDLMWVVGSVVLLVIDPFGISIVGNILIALVALIVAGMAIVQFIALKSENESADISCLNQGR